MGNISPADVALILLKVGEGRLEGKTILQKLAYFLSVKGDLPLGFSPHFYGPFSRDLEQSAELLVLSGHVREQTTILGTSAAGWPVRQTTYDLTDEGTEIAKKVESQHPDMADLAEQVVEKASREPLGLSPRLLSLAAKVHFILAAKALPMTAEEIAIQSQELGWEVQPSAVERCVELLSDLGLIEARTIST